MLGAWDVEGDHAVRAGKVCRDLGHLLEKIHTRGGGGEILVVSADLNIVAVGDDLAVQGCTHSSSPFR